MIDDDVRQLRTYSARWGRDLRTVQGPGGNTSVKRNGRLLVKASGMRLSEAEQRQVFVELDLDDARRMATGADAPPMPDGLRPSIETSFHAVMPHRFVMHVHATDVIAFAVRTDAERALAPLLRGLHWGWIPYVKPGAAIARGVQELLSRGIPDVVVLGNHGLIIGGDDCAEIDAKFRDVRMRLSAGCRTGTLDGERLARLADRFGLEPARFSDAHLAAADPVSLAYATAGTLYPDHVVFLGRGTGRLGENGPVADVPSLLHLAPGAGALLPVGAPLEAHEMAACLGAVTAAIPPGIQLATLTSAQEQELLSWDAETYRRQLARATERAH